MASGDPAKVQTLRDHNLICPPQPLSDAKLKAIDDCSVIGINGYPSSIETCNGNVYKTKSLSEKRDKWCRMEPIERQKHNEKVSTNPIDLSLYFYFYYLFSD